MATLSFRLPDPLVRQVRDLSGSLGLSKSDYLRRAIEDYNRKTQSELFKKQLRQSVDEVREQTLRVQQDMADSVDDGLMDD